MSASAVAFNTPIDAVQVAVLTITPAQLKLMDTLTGDSVTIVPAPGVKQLVEVIDFDVNMQFPVSGGVAYATGTGNLVMGVDSVGTLLPVWGQLLSNAGFKSGNSEYNKLSANLNGATGITTLVNKALQINFDGAGTLFTAGNSPVVVTVRYRIVTVV